MKNTTFVNNLFNMISLNRDESSSLLPPQSFNSDDIVHNAPTDTISNAAIEWITTNCRNHNVNGYDVAVTLESDQDSKSSPTKCNDYDLSVPAVTSSPLSSSCTSTSSSSSLSLILSSSSLLLTCSNSFQIAPITSKNEKKCIGLANKIHQ